MLPIRDISEKVTSLVTLIATIPVPIKGVPQSTDTLAAISITLNKAAHILSDIEHAGEKSLTQHDLNTIKRIKPMIAQLQQYINASQRMA